MQNSKFLIGVLLILAAISLYILQSKDKTASVTEDSYLVPELQTMINEVDKINISKDSQTITLSKQDEIWSIAEVDNYLADANKIAVLLLELRNFKLKEKKTTNADNYSKLALSDDTATKIVLSNAQGQFADISLGKKAQREQGTYVRINNQKQTWLATGLSTLKLEPKDWIITTILDVEVNSIKSVQYNPVDSVAFTINKLTPADNDFVLADIPTNKQIKADVKLDNLANGLQKFNIESAMTRTELPTDSKTMSINYQLFSGMSYQLNLYKQDQKHLLTIDIGNAENQTGIVNQLANWQFVIPEFKYQALHQNLADLIQEAPLATASEVKD
ncbi:MAG: DUF4340 domain-containing protein [Proteobacteria bacterium]|nr:DUF4340 domain-containing protein [Pseudomonadota bacterium]